MNGHSGEIQQPRSTIERAMFHLRIQKEVGLRRQGSMISEYTPTSKFKSPKDGFGYILALGSNRVIIEALEGNPVRLTNKFSVKFEEEKNPRYPSRTFPKHVVYFNDGNDASVVESRYTYHQEPSDPEGHDLDVFYENFGEAVRTAYIEKYGEAKGERKCNQALDQLADMSRKGVAERIEQAIKVNVLSQNGKLPKLPKWG